MASERRKKNVKIGVKKGGGPPPGYEWNIRILEQAHEEAIGFLNTDQYAHIAQQFKDLASLKEPTTSTTVDVRDIEDFLELRDKGGILQK